MKKLTPILFAAIGLFTSFKAEAQYCTPSYSSSSCYSSRYISYFAMTGFSNSTGNSWPYTNYSSTYSSTVQSGAVATFSITSPTECYAFYDIGIYVDFNHDFDFTDAGEFFSFYSSSNTYSGSFTIPSTALAGPTRLRVKVSNYSVSDPCYTYYICETEDYTLNIQPPAHCTPDGTTYNLLYLNRFTTAGINKLSGNDEGYADFTSLTPGTVIPGGVNACTVNIPDSMFLSLWLDMNNDFDFTDAGEMLFAQQLAPGNSTRNFSVPAGAPGGIRRLRVAVSYDSLTNPCSTSFFGEAEDYRVFVTNPCVHPPITVETVAQSPTSLFLDWESVDYAQNYQINYRIVGNAGWLSKTSTPSQYILKGLANNSTYEIRIRTKCAVGYSEWASLDTIETGASAGMPSCEAADDFWVTDITPSKAKIWWKFTAQTTLYQIRYRPTGFPVWITRTSPSPNRLLTALYSSTEYEYQIRANCTGGYWSDWSDFQYFTTADLSRPDTGLTADDRDEEFDSEDAQTDKLSIYPNPAHDILNFEGMDIANLKIMDAAGRTIGNWDAPGRSIKIEDLAPGIYFLRFETIENQVSVRRFVKN